MGGYHKHTHDHGCDHSHGFAAQRNKRNLWIALIITGSWMLIELIGGLITNSLALLADSGHMLSDFASLALSLVAITVATRSVTQKRTFGNYRFEILAAFINGLTLLLIAVYIFYQGIRRFLAPPEVESGLMMGIAAVGLVANILSMWVLMRGDTKDNLNMRSAFLHVAGDAIGSVGAITAGLLMYFFGWFVADPIISIFIGVLILISGCRVTLDAVHILLEGTPAFVDIRKVEKGLKEIAGVSDVHDVHVWTVTSGMHAFTCHLVLEPQFTGKNYHVLLEANRWIRDNLGIQHSTIQIEEEDLRDQEHPEI